MVVPVRARPTITSGGAISSRRISGCAASYRSSTWRITRLSTMRACCVARPTALSPASRSSESSSRASGVRKESSSKRLRPAFAFASATIASSERLSGSKAAGAGTRAE